ncbi:MAG: aminopeptidase N, partial [Desulfobulbaceae bacterium]|nr:aminopeptidase N [Desulfobulbaceae bacterium]
MDNEKPITILRKDYTVPDYLIDKVELFFELFDKKTIVTAKTHFSQNEKGKNFNPNLVLSGEELRLLSIRVDGEEIDSGKYHTDDKTLTIVSPPSSFILEITTELEPSKNTSLEGLYQSSGNYCTQCEAEGFRKITYYLDRPDVLAVFTTRIEGPKKNCPVMLSNGNCIKKGDLNGDRHYVIWHDPFPKPSYLFALVAGKLVNIEDKFITRSGKRIALEIYVEEKNRAKCGHAMTSLQKAMKWDEDVFGLEYDLETYMIVAVDDFNMGAMENKGLNIFNSKYVLSTPETATDEDYRGIEGVIGHEYFHNWTGNRITCRDWFQLSLKEGLTVFRDQEFSSDMNSRAVQRIKDIRILKNFQFREDGGPMAHPVRPESYQEINNFYTVTIYNKGAELIRMIHTLLGAEPFREGIDLYIKRHDGQAATCDDFVAAMSDASGIDLSQFKNWYSQSGTPLLKVNGKWDQSSSEFRLTLNQSCPETPGQREKLPFHLPVAVGLLGSKGVELIGTKVLQLKEREKTFTFKNIKEPPVVSLLRGFSAPVRVEQFNSIEELAFLMKHDSDLVNRWSAANQLAATTILKIVGKTDRAGESIEEEELYYDAVGYILTAPAVDPALLAMALQLPEEITLAQEMKVIDPDGLHKCRKMVKQELASRYQSDFLHLYNTNKINDGHQLSSEAMGRRSLKNTSLSFLMSLEPLPAEILALCVDQYRKASNMTDTIAALRCVVNRDSAIRSELLDDFYNKWHEDSLVMDKWFTLQAVSTSRDTLKNVKQLLENKLFSMETPNKVRSLIGAFCSSNHICFHEITGEGYSFLGDMIVKLNDINPQIAARLAMPLINWKRYDRKRQSLMKGQLDRLAGHEGLSRDVYE